MSKLTKIFMIVCLSIMVIPSIANAKRGYVYGGNVGGYDVWSKVHSNCEVTNCIQDPSTGKEQCTRVTTSKSRAGLSCK